MRIKSVINQAQKLTKIFQPINVQPKNVEIKKQELTSISQRLMLDMGVIRHANPGCYHLLPLGLRSIEKLTKIIDDEMHTIDAQKLALPYLTNSDLWKRTGRLDNEELFTLKDRHNKMYVLGPTYEEAITEIVASLFPVSYKLFPVYLYQITNKYRDEIKPRFGLIRGREFMMKDLYTFDINMQSAEKTYETVAKCYDNILHKIGINYVRVVAPTGTIGGTVSHEYHYITEIGEDDLLHCKNCQYSANVEISGREKCPSCESDKIVISKGIEIANTFLLGDKYSRSLKAHYLSNDGKPMVLQMGCYGIGLTRLMAAAIEYLSEENEMRWPLAIAPYKAIIISPKDGSKEAPLTDHLIERVQMILNSESALVGDILIDDRKHLTIGKRLFEARRMGYPFIIVIGDLALEDPPLYEIYDLIKNERHNYSESEMLYHIQRTLANPKVKERLYDTEIMNELI